jgi:high affinity sulfate transporter 1
MGLRQNIALFDWLPQYRGGWLRADVVAGLTTAAVVLPKAMAYATVAGLPIQIGLYTAFVPMLIYAALGTSRPLSVSTTTTLAILTGASISAAVPSGNPAALLQATLLLTMMVGGMLVVASLLRLGFVANFISEPVLVGFKAGIAVVIIVDQFPKLIGIHFEKGKFLHNLQEIWLALPQLSLATLAVGVGTIASLAAIERFRPHWPAPLIAVGGAIAGAGLLGWQSYGIALVGAIPSGLPSFALPDFSLAQQLWPGALGIALMSFTETIAAGRAFVGSDEPSPRANVELFATGAANIGGALLGSMPAGGGTSQTAVNRLTGARTQVAGVVTALMTLVTMFFLAPLIGLMPHATLAGVVIVYSIGLISPADFRSILQIRRTEFLWAVAAFLGVMLLGTLQGILVAIVVSVVALGHQVANPPVYELGRKRGTNVFRPRSAEHPDDESFPGLLMLRIEGRMFFLNAERIADKIRPLVEQAKPRVFVLDLSGVFDLEYSALKMLIESEKRQRGAGVSMWLAGLNPEVYAVVRRSALGEALGDDRLVFNLEMAVAKYQTLP